MEYSLKLKKILESGKKIALNKTIPFALAATVVATTPSFASSIKFENVSINSNNGNYYANTTSYTSPNLSKKNTTKVNELISQIDKKYDVIYDNLASGAFNCENKENSMARLIASINSVNNELSSTITSLDSTSKTVVEKYLESKENKLKLVYANFTNISLKEYETFAKKNNCVFANSISNNNLINVAIYKNKDINIISFDDSQLQKNKMIIVPSLTVDSNRFKTTYEGIAVKETEYETIKAVIKEIDNVYEKIFTAINKGNYNKKNNKQDVYVAIFGDTNLINQSFLNKYPNSVIKQYLEYQQDLAVSKVYNKNSLDYSEYLLYQKNNTPIRVSEEQGYVYYKLNDGKYTSVVDNGLIKTSDLKVSNIVSNIEKTETKKVTLDAYTGINIVVDDADFNPVDAKGNKITPFIYNGTTYLPARAICELFNADISWNSTTNTVSIICNGFEKVYIDNTHYYYEMPLVPNNGARRSNKASLTKLEATTNINITVDGNYYIPKDVNGNKVDVYVINGTTYLPARAIINIFGSEISWDKDNLSVVIERNPYVNHQGIKNDKEIIKEDIEETSKETVEDDETFNSGEYYYDDDGNRVYLNKTK